MKKRMMTRRDFLAGAGAFAGASAFMPSLWAAMKYDKKGVLDLFRLRAADTDARVRMWEVTNETLWGSYHTNPTTANLYRRDDLIEWSFDAEASDRCVMRGFYGTYDAEFTSNGKTVRKEIHLGRDLVPSETVTIG